MFFNRINWSQVCSNEGPYPFQRGDNFEIAKKSLTKFLKSPLFYFNQTWHKTCLGDEDSSLFK